MLQNILEKKILSKILEYRSDTLAVIVFGSSVYRGRGSDIDLVVVVEDYLEDPLRDSISLRLFVNKQLGYKVYTDIHVLSLEDFRKNLEVGSFLTGLALGYKVLYDKTGRIDKDILDFLKKVSKVDYVLVNKYGKWRLKYHAQRLLKRREQRRGKDPAKCFNN